MPHDTRSAPTTQLHRTAHDDFLTLSPAEQVSMVLNAPPDERLVWVRLLPLDDAADFVQAAPADERERLLALLDDAARREVTALMAYSEDVAGGLMNPRFMRLRPELTVDEAISYLRKQGVDASLPILHGYVLDPQQQLLGVVPIHELFSSQPGQRIRDVMTRPVAVTDDTDQEAVGQLFRDHGLFAVPVVDEAGRMKGVVTVDDIVHVIDEEATEDMQKTGGVAALTTPYLKTTFGAMLRKRGGWLTLLFFGEMLTATAMGWFEEQLAAAIVLALFVPLIISSGGNAGSQASTLVIRAMALGEITLRDWWLVVRREFSVGLALGLLLAVIGAVRIMFGAVVFEAYGDHYMALALTVSLSLAGVVLWGTVVGSTLPFVLRLLKLDPATASAPFVATLVDVTGLIIYFSISGVVLRRMVL